MKGKLLPHELPLKGRAALKNQKQVSPSAPPLPQSVSPSAPPLLKSRPSPSKVPMPKTLMRYGGGSYVIHTGVRGGKYIMVNNNKVYLRK